MSFKVVGESRIEVLDIQTVLVESMLLACQ